MDINRILGKSKGSNVLKKCLGKDIYGKNYDRKWAKCIRCKKNLEECQCSDLDIENYKIDQMEKRK